MSGIFQLQFETGNAAFDGKERVPEVVRCLQMVASKLTGGATEGPVYDVNGNRIGSWRMTPAKEIIPPNQENDQ